MKYRKKPVVIEAMLLSDSNKEEVLDWIASRGARCRNAGVKGITIETLEGSMLGNIGDYIIQGVQGEFYPCKPDIFEASYEEVAE